MKKIRKEDYLELIVFLLDYHSGQWSRGYRILSKLYPFRVSDDYCTFARETEIYHHLVEKYGEKV